MSSQPSKPQVIRHTVPNTVSAFTPSKGFSYTQGPTSAQSSTFEPGMLFGQGFSFPQGPTSAQGGFSFSQVPISAQSSTFGQEPLAHGGFSFGRGFSFPQGPTLAQYRNSITTPDAKLDSPPKQVVTTITCDACNADIPHDSYKTHVVRCKVVECECGESFTHEKMRDHMRVACTLRFVQCPNCECKVRSCDVSAHITTCATIRLVDKIVGKCISAMKSSMESRPDNEVSTSPDNEALKSSVESRPDNIVSTLDNEVITVDVQSPQKRARENSDSEESDKKVAKKKHRPLTFDQKQDIVSKITDWANHREADGLVGLSSAQAVELFIKETGVDCPRWQGDNRENRTAMNRGLDGYVSNAELHPTRYTTAPTKSDNRRDIVKLRNPVQNETHGKYTDCLRRLR